jgi:hypothetical protein
MLRTVLRQLVQSLDAFASALRRLRCGCLCSEGAEAKSKIGGVRCRKWLPAEGTEVRPAPGGYSSAAASDVHQNQTQHFATVTGVPNEPLEQMMLQCLQQYTRG